MDITNSLPNGTALMGGKYVTERVLNYDNTTFTYLARMISQSEDVDFGNGYIHVIVKELYLQDFQFRDADGIKVMNYNEEKYNYRTDFENEANSLSTLRHPNLLRITEVFEENETVYYVSDYLHTTPLADYVRQHGPLSEHEVLNIVRDVSGALRQMHQNGIIHSNVTPDSIQIDKQGRAYLSDFGFERIDEEIDHILPVYYTYHAPEYISAPTSGQTVACDIYSLGAIIYYMLTRQAPPSHGDLYDGFPKSELLLFASAHTVDCIAKAMSLRRSDRYVSLDAMMQDLGKPLPPLIPSRTSDSSMKNALPVGTMVESQYCQYEITKILAQGTFGITYLADLLVKGNLGVMRSNVKVCVKEFFMKEVNGRKQTIVTSRGQSEIYEKYRGKFIQESLHLAEMKHPNIVKVLEAFEANNTYYYVMEFIEGMSLDDYIMQRDGLPLQEAVIIINEIGQALSHMHKNNMLHLDLKPLNVMRRADGHVVLIDFGLSKQYLDDGSPETSTSIGAGTPGYAPLEQMNYHEGKGFPVSMDVYALAATFYKMLTGRTPQKSADILNDGLDKKPLIQRGIGNDTIALLEAGMSPTRKGRLQSVDEFLDRVNRLL